MYCEIYIDSLFLVYFCMNIYVLRLLNVIFHNTATLRRILPAAFVGAVCLLAVFFLPGNGMVRMLICSLLSAISMLGITFRMKSFSTFLRLMEALLFLVMLLGGVLYLLIRVLPLSQQLLKSVMGMMLLAGFAYEILLWRVKRLNKKKNECKVTLSSSHSKIKVNALMDTGNTLIEPISGKPVSVLEKGVFENLFLLEKPEGFRAIPYHSIGKKDGILQGYLLPKMEVEIEGITKVYQNIYIAICPDVLTNHNQYKMILNPQVLE